MKMSLVIFLFLIGGSSSAQRIDAGKAIQAGNDFYKQQQFNKAAIEYNKAIEADPANNTAKFNKANAVYKQDQKVDAAKLYAEVAKSTAEKELRSKAYYNKGVILSQQQNLEESIEAYKNSLRNNQDDKEARENLQKALLELKKKVPPKKKDDDQQKKKKEQEQQKKQQQSKMNQKEADQRLKLLQQKEKEVQQRLQKEKAKTGGSQAKDW